MVYTRYEKEHAKLMKPFKDVGEDELKNGIKEDGADGYEDKYRTKTWLD